MRNLLLFWLMKRCRFKFIDTGRCSKGGVLNSKRRWYGYKWEKRCIFSDKTGRCFRPSSEI